MPAKGLEEFAVEHDQMAALRQANQRLMRQLAEAKAKTDAIVEATLQGARDAYLSLDLPPVRPPKKDARRNRAEVALWHLTDWQGAKLTTSYNSEIMVERVQRFIRGAEKITEIQRKDHPVKDAVVVFGGDMVEGLFNFPTQPFEIDASIFGQYVAVSALLIDAVKAALRIHENVTVVSEWGNHGRIGSKRDAVPRNDNIDRMCYEHARQMLSGESRLKWEDGPEDIQRVEIGSYRALVIHGDEIGRTGFASPATIKAACDRWGSGAYPWEFRDVYMGHYHTHAEWPLANGEGALYQTGSTESDNRYARDTMASSARPSQRLHFIDPDKGRVTSQYKIWLAGSDVR